MDDLRSQVWWNSAFVIANAVLLGRRGYINYKEDGASAAERFSLRANSLPYITVWGFFAILTIVFAVLSEQTDELINAAGILALEFIAICLWHHHFGNGELMRMIVKETRERHMFLLVQGLGMKETEVEQHLFEIEKRVVDLWTEQLKEKEWNRWTKEGRDALLFNTGYLSGKVLEDHLWEGVLYGVEAFFPEWDADVEYLLSRGLRVQEDVKQGILQENNADKQNLYVAVLVANEDANVRRLRGSPSLQSGQQFCAARIARRKAAAEGILRYPNCLLPKASVHVSWLKPNVDNLEKDNGNKEFVAVADLCELPHSVLYTLKEVLDAGYLKINKTKPTDISVVFKYGQMVFPKDQWNPVRTIQRKPFRYITSATWMSGDIAFAVEQREKLPVGTVLDGSGSLQGVLSMQISATEQEEEYSWLDRSAPPNENETIWGDLGDISHTRPTNWLNRPILWSTKLFWMFVECLVATKKKVLHRGELDFPLTGRTSLWRSSRIRLPHPANIFVQSASGRDEQNVYWNGLTTSYAHWFQEREAENGIAVNGLQPEQP